MKVPEAGTPERATFALLFARRYIDNAIGTLINASDVLHGKEVWGEKQEMDVAIGQIDKAVKEANHARKGTADYIEQKKLMEEGT